MTGRRTDHFGDEERLSRAEREIARRIDALAAARYPVTTRHAEELSEEERARYGFAPDWRPSPQTRRRRRP
jgi:hypothetical protein